MVDSLLYDILYDWLSGYRGDLEKEMSYWAVQVNDISETLKNSFSKEQLVLLEKFKSSLLLKQEYINIKYEKKLLNLGVRIGMQLQKAFDEEKD